MKSVQNAVKHCSAVLRQTALPVTATKGQGIQGLGPNLTDNVWLWGGTQKSIIETITNGRHSQMPAWGRFLDKDKLHIMTAYVWGLSNKDGKVPVKKPNLLPHRHLLLLPHHPLTLHLRPHLYKLKKQLQQLMQKRPLLPKPSRQKKQMLFCQSGR